MLQGELPWIPLENASYDFKIKFFKSAQSLTQ